MENTIFSLVTKPITQNIAIIRISGDDSFDVTNKMLKVKLDKKQIQLRTLFNNKEEIDNVMILKFDNPNSFTGEDVIEIQCHGSLIIVNEIIGLLLKNGIIQAKPGEFSQRAMLNGKIDLVQAESINTLIFSKNIIEKQKSLEDLQGYKKELIKNIQKEVIEIKTHLETNIDYPEYLDIKNLSNNDIVPRINKLIKETDKIIENSNKIKPAIKGFDIAIIGKPNVGKSSLLNFLLNKDKAIVSDEEGTTRDLIEEAISFKGINFNLIDTAGIREATNKVEKIGIDKTKKRIEDVSLIIDVYDGSIKSTKEDKEILELAKKAKHHISVINKIDKKVINDVKGINISIKDKNIKPLIKDIENHVDKILKDVTINDHSYFINERQTSLISKINEILVNTNNELKKQIPVDIMLIHINEIEETLNELSGNLVEEHELRNIFDNFCLGK
jgi:tRNA modification GTPase